MKLNILEPTFLPVNKKVYVNLRKFKEITNAAGCSYSGEKYYFLTKTISQKTFLKKIQFLSDGWTKIICQDGVVGVTSKLSISYAMRNECFPDA